MATRNITQHYEEARNKKTKEKLPVFEEDLKPSNNKKSTIIIVEEQIKIELENIKLKSKKFSSINI